jgi:HAE1 family hydrophobic/amphiphilic exporter-1
VYADVSAGGLENAIAGVRTVLEQNPPPAGVRVEVGGENETMRRSFRELGFAFSLAILLVFMILAAEFESFVYPFMILLTVPMGLVGAIVALWATGTGINTMSLIGIVILAGIVDNDAVVKIDFINQMRRQGMSVREAILAAGHARLRPILMTTITTLLGVLPMALAAGRGAELRAPLAVSIFGGLFSATAMTLIVLPVIYEIVENARERVRVWRRVPVAAEGEGVIGAVPGD